MTKNKFHHVVILLTLFVNCFVLNVAFSQPFVPAADDEVVEVLPVYQIFRGTKKVIKQEAPNPKSVTESLEVAFQYIEIARKYNEPRYYGLAESVISPWWGDESDLDVQLIKAIILQFNHQFIEAKQVLDKVLVKKPSYQQAILSRSSINLVLGKYNEVESDCKKIDVIQQSLISLACFAQISIVQNDKYKMKTLSKKIDSILFLQNNYNDEEKQWVLHILSDLKYFDNDKKSSREALKNALEIDEYSLDSRLKFADYFLYQGEFQMAFDLLSDFQNHVSALIRLVYASSHFSSKIHNQLLVKLNLQVDELKRRDIKMHLREFAFISLYIDKDYELGLKYASENWLLQKEIVDVALYWYAIEKNNSQYHRAKLNDWKSKENFNVDLQVAMYYESP